MEEKKELSVKLNTFEGPLDLLLALIEKNKVSIYDIPIAEITDQYMEYVNAMQTEDLDTMSDFLVMAATLLEIKSKMLLPAEKNEDDEEIDPREELVRQLLEYRLAKEESGRLKEREENAGGAFYRKEKLPKEVLSYREPVDPDKVLGDVTLSALRAVFADVMKRQENRVDPIRSSFGNIQKEKVDTRAVMRNVTGRILHRRKCTFRSLLEESSGKTVMVVTFMTVLELTRMGKIRVAQDTPFGEIYIAAVPEKARKKSEKDSAEDKPENEIPEAEINEADAETDLKTGAGE